MVQEELELPGEQGRRKDEKSTTKLGYDRSTVISAFQKELRAGRLDEATYWGVHLAQETGAAYVWRRLMICAAEDVGLPALETVMRVGQLYQMWKGCVDSAQSQWAIPLHHLVLAIVLVARAAKDTTIEDLLTWTKLRLKAGERLPILPAYEDPHTPAGRAAGKGWASWYSDRLNSIEANEFTRRVWELKPEWKPEGEPHHPERGDHTP